MDNITLITILSLSFSFVIIMVKICIKNSKCNEINFCGIKIKRDIKSEIDQYKYDVENGINKDDEINELKNVVK
jgi:hypothetical protein